MGGRDDGLHGRNEAVAARQRNRPDQSDAGGRANDPYVERTRHPAVPLGQRCGGDDGRESSCELLVVVMYLFRAGRGPELLA